jgi:tRNA-2-methylthio-N6-dimethylallyladenosine synthase
VICKFFIRKIIKGNESLSIYKILNRLLTSQLIFSPLKVKINFEMPKVWIETFGCQMNEWDSQAMLGVLRREGWEATTSPEEADLLLINTCSVRKKPEEKALSVLGYLTKLKREKPHILVGVAGCMAQRMGDELLKRFPLIDFVLGTGQVQNITSIVDRARTRKVVALQINGCAPTLPTLREKQFQAYIPIIFGCDNFCSYCIVPFVRGRERSRPLREIVEEAKNLIDEGVIEITLLGQNVNAYGRDLKEGYTFVDLLYALGELPIKRIKFTTSHPKGFSPELIKAIASIPAVCHWIHLPIQSGDDKILKAMRRGYTISQYKSLVEEIRENIPDVSITTDVMVGFPGEGEEEFRNTLRIFEEIEFDQAFMFAFSPRPGTLAEKMEGQVEQKEKIRRLRELISLQNEISRKKNLKILGKTLEVLVEGEDPKGKGFLVGKSRENKTVVFPGERKLIGKLVRVRTKEAFLWGFKGEMDNEEGEG